MRILTLFLLCMAVPAQAQLLTGWDPVAVKPKIKPVIERAPAPIYRSVSAPKPQSMQQEAPVDFEATQLDYDENTKIIEARGDVILQQQGRILRADHVEYNLENDTGQAEGNVVLNEPSGDMFQAAEASFENNLADGWARDVKGFIADGSRFEAEQATRTGATLTQMDDAMYTACEACKDNPSRAPVWRIKAHTVSHDKETQNISYDHARFEMLGVPLLYLPRFSHPDPTVQRRSGFLTASGGFKSDLGAFMENRYYFDVAPEKDLTVGLTAYSNENPLLQAQWRQRFESAYIDVAGGITYSGRTDDVSGLEVEQPNEVRGHVDSQALWNINQKWRAGLDLHWASDDQYMRQYDINNEDVLTSEAYAERFSGRNYAAVRAMTFQDIRVQENQIEQPEILPEALFDYQGKAQSVPIVGGNWFLTGNYLGLRREGDEQNIDRIHLVGGWKKRLISRGGGVGYPPVRTAGSIQHAEPFKRSV